MIAKAAQLMQHNRIFFDITHLIEYTGRIERYSGIQRVVVMTLRHVARLTQTSGLFLTYVDKKAGVHKCIPYEDIGEKVLGSASLMRQQFFPGRLSTKARSVLRRYKKSFVKKIFYRVKLDLCALCGWNRPFRRFGMEAAEWRGAGFRRRGKSSSQSQLADVAENGDALILLDSTWDAECIVKFREANDNGMQIYTFVHDLIPVVCSYTTHGGTPRVFAAWLRASVEYTYKFITNSECTRRDLKRFMDSCGENTPIAVVRLAQDGLAEENEARKAVGTSLDGGGTVSGMECTDITNEIRVLLLTQYVLCVGTIEARKNVWRLAAAWKRLIDKGVEGLPRLVFAGRRGWLSDSFFDLMSATGNLYGYATIVEAPSDQELDFLYRNCLFAVMVSIYEGWGLPVGEALGYGKTAVVARAASLPEVGQEFVEYCDPHSIESIADAVFRLIHNPERRVKLESAIQVASLRSWEDVAKELLAVVGQRDLGGGGEVIVGV